VGEPIDDHATDAVVLDMVPHMLVGIEFRRVGRKMEDPQAALGGIDKLSDLRATVDRMLVDDQEHGASLVMQESLEKIDEDFRSQVVLRHHEAEGALGIDGGEQVELEPRPRGLDDGRLALLCPGGAGMVIRTDGGFVAEIDAGSSSLGHSLDPGVVLSHPGQDQFPLLLRGAPLRALRSQPDLLQKASHRNLAQANIEFPPDQLPDHGAGPQSKGKLQLQGIAADNAFVDDLQLLPAQLRSPARGRAGFECLDSPFAVPGNPFIDPGPGQPKSLNDDLGTLSSLDPLHGPDSNLLQGLPVQFAPIEFSHEHSIPYVR